MVDINDLVDSRQAAEYINNGLKERGLKGWSDPISSLGVAVMKKQIKPVQLPGSNNVARVPKRYFDRETCDQFIANYRSPGNQPADLSPIIDRLGQAPDTKLAEEVGVTSRTIGRERQRRGVAKYKK